MVSPELTYLHRESADNCHISHQVQHDPKYTMDEAYAYKACFNVYLALLDNFSFEVLIRCENLSKYVFLITLTRNRLQIYKKNLRVKK